MTRATVAIFDRWLYAHDLNEVLRKAGIDSKVVTKHAVQVHPGQVEMAKAACVAERAARDAAEAERLGK